MMSSHFRTFNILATFILLLVKPQFSYGQAWVAENTWTVETETEYAEWFKKNATTKYFVDKDNKLAAKIGVDCGKAAYAFRAVFAFEKKLPFKVLGNDLKWMDAQSGNYFGSTPQEKLVSYLTRIVSNTSVESLKYNTFPIVLHKNFTTSGVLYVFQMPGVEENKAGRHTYMLKDIDASGIPHFIFATVPAIPRPLSERRVFPFFMPLNPTFDNQWGFRRFLQPQDYEVFNNMKARMKGVDANSEAGERILRDVPADLRQRGYDPNHQRKVAESVLKYYEERVEFFKNGPKHPGFSEKIDIPEAKPKAELDKAAAMRIWRKLNDPFYRETNIVDEIIEDYRKALLQKYRDQIEMRRKIIEEYTQLNPNEKHLNVPALVKSGTFISDPPNAPYDLTVTGIYAQQLINIFATNKEESLLDKLKRNFFNLCGYAQDRAQAVKEGNNYFFGKKIVTASDEFARCPTQDEVYDYTTHERDAELTSFIGDARKHYMTNKAIIKKQYSTSWYLIFERIFNEGKDFANNADLMKQAEDLIMNSKDTPSSERCEIEISKNKMMSIWQVVSIMGIKEQASPVPWQDINKRWGLTKLSAEDKKHFTEFSCETKE